MMADSQVILSDEEQMDPESYVPPAPHRGSSYHSITTASTSSMLPAPKLLGSGSSVIPHQQDKFMAMPVDATYETPKKTSTSKHLQDLCHIMSIIKGVWVGLAGLYINCHTFPIAWLMQGLRYILRKAT